jgi:hypothetical protein
MNTILTTTTGNLGADEIAPFFNSLRQCGYLDEVVVFASGISNETRALFQKYEAKVIDFEYRGMPILIKNPVRRYWLKFLQIYRYYTSHRRGGKDFDSLNICCSRFFHYKNYLQELEHKPEKIFLADVRDIVFQRNPFSFPFEPGLSVAIESRRIGQSVFGVKQLLITAGLTETFHQAQREVINGGTIVGDYNTIIKYLDLLTTHFNKVFFWGLIEVIDQALTTLFVHKKLVTPVHSYHNWDGPFLTLDSVLIQPENKNSEGYLCNRDGSVIPIVHQYDRVAGLYRVGEPKPDCWCFYQSKP